MDYNQATIDEILFEDVRVAGEPLSHMAHLEAATLAQGFYDSIIVLNRDGNKTMIEGHHRSAIAWKHRMAIDAEIHNCSCRPGELDSFGLCKIIWEACEKAQIKAGREGWDWKQNNYGEQT